MSAVPAYSVKIVPAKGDGDPYMEVVWRSLAAERRADGSRPQVKRRIGRAWHERVSDGTWRRRRGAPPAGWFLHGAQATTLAAADKVREVEADLRERAAERARGDATVRRLAADWLEYQVRRGAKPSYLRNSRSMLAEPGVAYRRGAGSTKGRLMATFGDRDARRLTTDDVEGFLLDANLSPANYNRHRDLLLRILRFTAERDRLPGLHDAIKAVERVRKRREDDLRGEATYSPAEVERIAEALRAGLHVKSQVGSPRANAQDAAIVLVLLYTGLRVAEALALEVDQLRDLDGDDPHLIVSAALSARERSTPKNRQSRRIALAPQAVSALLSVRGFWADSHDAVVFRGRHGGYLDDGALRRRFRTAREAAGVPDRGALHVVRHATGTTIAAAHGLAAARDVLGHAKISTTDRYLRGARIAQDGRALGAAFADGPVGDARSGRELAGRDG